jgi:hypothetical protein
MQQQATNVAAQNKPFFIEISSVLSSSSEQIKTTTNHLQNNNQPQPVMPCYYDCCKPYSMKKIHCPPSQQLLLNATKILKSQ